MFPHIHNESNWIYLWIDNKIDSFDVFWHPSDGGMMTLSIPPTFIDLIATWIPAIT
jgi:hypothetical protein